MKKCLGPLRSLAVQLAGLQAEARALGMFVGDRELLACHRCGLMEDVTFAGLLITYQASALGADTGMRFEEIKAGKFRCPKCGGIATETLEKPGAKAKPAKRKIWK